MPTRAYWKINLTGNCRYPTKRPDCTSNPYIKTPHHLACVRAAFKNSRSRLFKRYGRLNLPVGWAVMYTNMYQDTFVRLGHTEHVQIQKSGFLDLVGSNRCNEFEEFLYGLLDKRPAVPQLAPTFSRPVDYRPPVVVVPKPLPEHKPPLLQQPPIPTLIPPPNHNSGSMGGWFISLSALALVGAFVVSHIMGTPKEGHPQADIPSPPRIVEIFKEVVTDCLNIRSTPTAKTPLGILPRETKVKIVGPNVEGWEEVEINALPASSCGPAIPAMHGYVYGPYLTLAR